MENIYVSICSQCINNKINLTGKHVKVMLSVNFVNAMSWDLLLKYTK